MSLSTEEKTDARSGGPPNGAARMAKRYAPFIAILVVVAAVVVIFGGDGGGDGDEGTDTGGEVAADREELIRSGPMTAEKAELTGEDVESVDFGPHCDRETGRIMLPTVMAPPCVEAFTGDNGGATSPGVTADEIKIVSYRPNPDVDPLGASLLLDAGADVSAEAAQQAVEGYVNLYNEVFETYGRRVVVEPYLSTGPGDDPEAARRDAQAIAEMEPFAVVGGPAQTSPIFAGELAPHGIVCGPECTSAVPEAVVDEGYPYLWQVGPTPEQAAMLAAEMIGNLAGPGPAAMAGDPALRERDRVYGLVHYDTPDGDHQPVFEALREQLSGQGIDIGDRDVPFNLNIAEMQEDARTIISRLKSQGVTTVIYYGDPLTPGPLTEEATAQNYHPEWILGPSLLADTTIFARLTDGQQWKNGFGISYNPARGERSTTDSFAIYEWAYGEQPPTNVVRVLEPPLRTIFSGIHMAGPELSPQAFRDGLYRLPASASGPTHPTVSRGNHGIWEGEDRGGVDDAAIIWWDPDATGEDETGNPGQGMYRYANGGQRYRTGEFPTSPEEAGLFDEASSVTVFEELPPGDRAPDYPPPEIPGRTGSS